MTTRSLTLAALCVACSRDGGARPDPILVDPLIVHEWGTFATFQGSSGGMLDGMQHETESLPRFVHSLTTAHASPFAPFGDPSFDVPIGHVGGKMETPVIYFYSQTRRDVRVHVDFTAGLMTQWWPRATSTPMPVSDVGDLTKSSLEWQLELVPGAAPAGVPYVSPDDPWSFARETKAAWVRAGNEAERYVFYRGLGRIQLPIAVNAMAGGMTLVHDCSDEPLAEAFVLDMHATEGRFVSLGAFTPHQAKPAMQGAMRPRQVVVDELKLAMHAALVSHGLFADEARAMIRTWERTWFAAEGTRVIYVVPSKHTAAILPLTIEPKPDSLVRVLVGRHEFLTPEREAELVVLVKQRLEKRSQEGATHELAKLGRFLEPAMRRLAAVGDANTVKAALEVLATFARSRNEAT